MYISIENLLSKITKLYWGVGAFRKFKGVPRHFQKKINISFC